MEEQAVCVSCHRALSALPMMVNTLNSNPTNTATNASFKTGGAVICSLCSSLTCVICSRQCTCTPLPPSSPLRKRTIALTLANTDDNNIHSAGSSELHVIGTDATRRRKVQDDPAESEDVESSRGAGCGRTVCRACCVENEATHANTCLKCCHSQEHLHADHYLAQNTNEHTMG
ncbi:hypothetical protein JB92DRAFT_3064644 [Gautieria morchelliformis]|nr:hypothetical protein JB92DRAFT_3064644 [Gautieria morchelliformis]